jgi:DNA replication protein DnaC
MSATKDTTDVYANGPYHDTTDLDLVALQTRSDERRRQLAVEAPEVAKPVSWLADIVPAIMARQAEAEQHATECTDRPCERCEKFVCKCGAAVDGARECAPCAERSRLREQMRTTLASIPEDFRWALGANAMKLRDLSPRTGRPFVSLTEAQITRCLEAPPGQNLHFRGRVGAGKTTLAIAMLWAWVSREPHRRRGAFYVEASVLARARAGHSLGDGEAPLVAKALRAPLVLLDDLGHEANDRDNCISDVVYGRARDNRPTWITTGIVADKDVMGFTEALTERYDGGFARRVVEMGKPIRLGAK